MKRISVPLALVAAAAAILAAACGGSSNDAPAPAADVDPPEVQVGERLFLETRFAQFFFANSGGDVNATLPAGDPVMDTTVTTGEPLPGPFRGLSMNCRACHLVDEFPSRVRTYDDLARRSPIPERGDGAAVTPRNSPPLVNATLPRTLPLVLHFDGEFASITDLIVDTFTGRNFGWLPSEQAVALSHIANVIRNDDGKNELARSFGGGGVPYSALLLGTDPAIPAHLRLPSQYRLDVSTASDAAVVNAVAALVGAYVDSLRFSTDDSGDYNASPYDVFLSKNGLPRHPDEAESGIAYGRRLLAAVNQLSKPVFVTQADGKFKFHPDQRFRFGETELQGLRIFLTEGSNAVQAHAGNCIACHTPPDFTDFAFHNNGASQIEYDGVFGDGAFASLSVPDLAARNADFDAYLPPTPSHPNASGRFRSPALASKPGYTDLGAWNIVGNPDLPAPQNTLSPILCGEFNLTGPACNAAALLPLTIAYFKTPTVRDLGQSAPYLHTGALDTIDDVLSFYIRVSTMARQGLVRNGSPELSGIFIDDSDTAALDAFLKALNEDYN